MTLSESGPGALKVITVQKVTGTERQNFTDTLAVEEPLEINLVYGPLVDRIEKKVSVTMRTPGNDADLAVGFLFTEGIIPHFSDIQQVQHPKSSTGQPGESVIEVTLAEGCQPRLLQAERNFYTTSSCGVCGKSSIDAVKTVNAFCFSLKPGLQLRLDVVYSLPGKLKNSQAHFSSTGGIHGCGLFDRGGNLLMLREDVGRHNALDKLIGAALTLNMLPLHNAILLLSGRASFELIQKAAMAGVQVVAAIGAPSSLAVELAREFDITLLGFLKNDRFNIYHQSTSITTV